MRMSNSIATTHVQEQEVTVSESLASLLTLLSVGLRQRRFIGGNLST